ARPPAPPARVAGAAGPPREPRSGSPRGAAASRLCAPSRSGRRGRPRGPPAPAAGLPCRARRRHSWDHLTFPGAADAPRLALHRARDAAGPLALNSLVRVTVSIVSPWSSDCQVLWPDLCGLSPEWVAGGGRPRGVTG